MVSSSKALIQLVPKKMRAVVLISEYEPWTHSISITWELGRHAKFQAPPESETLKLGPSNLCFNQ